MVNDFDASRMSLFTRQLYNESEDTDFEVEEEEKQLEVAQTLYDEYKTLVSSVLLDAPILSELRFNECEQVILFPCHQVDRNDLVRWTERIRFFTGCLNDLVKAALSEALAGM